MSETVQSEHRKRAEEEFRRLRDVLPQYICAYEADGTPLYANDSLLDYFGFTLDDFRADDFQTRAFHPDDVERVQSVRKSAMARCEGWETEARIRRKDGEYRWFLIRGKPLRDDAGKIVRWFSSGTDIDDRKQAEAELRQLVDAVPQHIVVLDGEGRRLYANRVVLDYHGYSLDEFLIVDHSECFHHDDLESYDRLREGAIANGKGWEAEVRLRRKDGQYRWFLMRSNPLRDDQGHVIRWYLTRTDIEDRKTAERALEREKDRLGLMLEFTNKLVTKLDLRELLRTVAGSVRRVIPCDLVAIFLPDSQPDFLRSFVVDFPGSKGFILEEGPHPSSRHSISINETLAGRVFRTGEAWAGTVNDLLRLGLKNDPGIAEDLKTVSVLPVACCDKVLGVLALARREAKLFAEDELDLLHQVAGQVAIAIVNALVTEDRKYAEEALRRSEGYLAEAQRLSHTGSYAHDVSGEIIYLSEEAYRIFGFDPAAGTLTYEQVRSRVHPEDVHIFEACSEEVIRQKKGSRSDFRLLLPDAAIKHIHCVSRPVFDTSGEVVEVVGTNMDVTEQYQANAALEKAFEEIKQLRDELYRENLALKEEIDHASMFEEIVGASEVLRRVLVQVSKVAPADSTVLITGETGTGKELIARAIHRRSHRSSKAFVSVNCAAIPATLIGSELFGHEKGAFTGATQRRLGRFELADGGTLFLDEVGDLPAETQIALLRVLQEHEFERIGGAQPIGVNVRIIAATNRDLKAAIRAGTFRDDLFYRLNVFPIAVPPLRDRKDDIPLLVEYLIERYASRAGKKIKHIPMKILELFKAYDWPGNIRELQNVIERAVILSEGETFSVDESWLYADTPRLGMTENEGGLARLDPQQERKLIEAALTQTRGQIAGPSGAAAKLGIPRSTLETKIRKLGIAKHRFKSASSR